MNNLSKYLKYLGGVVALLLVFGSGYLVRDLGARSDMTSLLKDHEIQLQEIEVARNENTTLVRALADSESNRSVLLDEIASLRDAPAEIQYITRVETVLVGSETIVTNELPDSHLFVLENGLPVAEFAVEPGENDSPPEYYFDTADLTVRADVVVGAQESAISVRMESDLDPGNEREIPVKEFNVQHIRERKLFETNITVGVGLSAGPHADTRVRPAAYAGASFIHPANDRWDFAQVRVGLSGGTPEVGFDPALYNVGDALPVITNLWVAAGPTIGLDGQWAGTVTIGAKL